MCYFERYAMIGYCISKKTSNYLISLDILDTHAQVIGQHTQTLQALAARHGKNLLGTHIHMKGTANITCRCSTHSLYMCAGIKLPLSNTIRTYKLTLLMYLRTYITLSVTH